MTDPKILLPVLGSEVTRRAVLRAAVAGGSAAAMTGLLAACSTQSAAPASSGKPVKGGTLRVGAAGGGSNDTLDAHVGITQLDNLRLANLYDQLTQIDNTFTYKLRLAESVEPNSDATSWTVRLRDGVEFHNGKTLDADDLIFTINRIFDPKLIAFGAVQLAGIDTKNIKKVDSRTVQIGMTSPRATLAVAFGDGQLCNIVPVDYDPKNPVGTGPFKFKSFTPGQQSTFERFANYWDTPAHLDQLVIQDITDDSARVNAILSGQVDAISQVPFAQIPTVKGTSGLSILQSKTGSFQPLVMRCDTGPFKDVRVRQALRLAVDRDQTVKVAISGYGATASDVYSPFDKAFDKSLTRKRDIAQAKSLLAQAGYKGESIELVTSNIGAGVTEFCSVVVQNAKDAGLNLVVKTVDPATLFGANNLQWPLSVTTWPSASFLTTAAAADVFPGNGAHYSNAAYTKLYNQAEATLDENARNEVVRQMQKILFDEGPYMIPYFPDTVDAYRSTFQGWPKEDLTGLGLGRGAFKDVYRTS